MAANQINQSAIRPTNPRSRPYYNRGNSTTMDSLPDELLFEILTRVSAQDIHQKARFVCKRWKLIVHGDAFVYEHLRRTSYGLLLPPWRRPAFVTAAQGGEIEVSELSYKRRSSVRASCNGLVLEMDGRGRALRIMNPVTKGCFDLPELPDFAPRPDFCMAYAAASMEYKVVATYYRSGSDFDLRQCSILTVGAGNTWRHVSTQQLTLEAKDLLRDDPSITEGFVHWASSSRNGVLTMNVETEVFAESSHAPLCPPDYQFEGSKYHYLSTGRYLSVLIPCGEVSWEVWEMKPETGEWRKPLQNNIVNLKAHESKIQQLVLEEKDVIYPAIYPAIYPLPAGWVKYPEVLLFFLNNRSIIIYDLDNDKIESVTLRAPIPREAVLHKHSVVCLS